MFGRKRVDEGDRVDAVPLRLAIDSGELESLGATVGIAEGRVGEAVDRLDRSASKFVRLWRYYRNPARLAQVAGGTEGSTFRLGQEDGLPGRVTGRFGSALVDDRFALRREVVIENDIQWRIHAMVDFLFGKGVAMVSKASDERDRERVERLLELVWEYSGGDTLLHDAALLGHVYGHVDLLLRIDESRLRAAASLDEDERLVEAARSFSIEVIEPRLGSAILDGRDWRRVVGYVVSRGEEGSRDAEVFGPGGRAWSNDAGRGFERSGVLGDRVPIVHIQNVMQPLRHSGIGDVEPLVPLQDELNTRLSDRANRVALQSFKMYLAKGIDGFETMGIGPGQVFSTDNPDASIESFGGDGSSPSEDRHVAEVRQAIDKLSGVPPIASGVVEAKIGNLTSANALRVTMVGLLTRTQRKRVTYGGGVTGVCGLVLDAANETGVLSLSDSDRRIGLEWPDPLPADEQDVVLSTRAKRELGIPDDRILDELGYVPTPGAGSAGVNTTEVTDV